MVLRRRKTVVGGKCALPSALLVLFYFFYFLFFFFLLGLLCLLWWINVFIIDIKFIVVMTPQQCTMKEQMGNYIGNNCTPVLSKFTSSFSSSRMRVMNHNWSARKQRLHRQSVASISRHSAFRIRQCGTLSGSFRKDTDQCL